jgi:hypothetical protein
VQLLRPLIALRVERKLCMSDLLDADTRCGNFQNAALCERASSNPATHQIPSSPGTHSTEVGVSGQALSRSNGRKDSKFARQTQIDVAR